jgi:hypothetical protein
MNFPVNAGLASFSYKWRFDERTLNDMGFDLTPSIIQSANNLADSCGTIIP